MSQTDSPSQDTKGQRLEREVGLVQLTFYGTGTILGAGIFVVIGEVVGEAGALSPLAYLLAAVVAVTSALAFSEMAARIPTAGGPIDYIETASGHRRLGSAAGWALLVANIVSAATITTGFVSYLQSFWDVAYWIPTLALVAVIGGIAALGMKESAWLMIVTTFVGLLTLAAILWVLRDGLVAGPGIVWNAATGGGEASAAEGVRGGWSGLVAGAFLAVYSFVGFGDMATTAEEVKDVRRILPRAMMLSLAIVSTLYLAVALALVGAGGLGEIAEAQAPLVRAAVREGWPLVPLALASLVVIFKSALPQVVASARLVLDLARDGRGAPALLARVNGRTDTPLLATALIASIVLALALFVPLKSLATGTSFALLLVFFGVNLSLVALKRRDQPDGVPDVPAAVAWVGAATTLAALLWQAGSLLLGL